MTILTFIDNRNKNFKKSDFELVYFSSLMIKEFSGKNVCLVLGNAENAENLGKFGANEVLHFDFNGDFDFSAFTSIISQVVGKVGADMVLLPHNSTGKSLLGSLAIRLNAALVSGIIDMPTKDGEGFIFKKGTFSSKAFSYIRTMVSKTVISLMPNSFSPIEVGAPVSVEKIHLEIPQAKTKVIAVEKVTGKVPLPEADMIVSGGRGMKGPENWGVLLDLAEVLGASTACSRPVADVDWRPHGEHVGQTGIVVRPNLYIALGISGAIQHLAGVNSSKVIVVVNKDPEAPFFKSATYGVVGDIFEVVPKLTEEIKKFKSAH